MKTYDQQPTYIKALLWLLMILDCLFLVFSVYMMIKHTHIKY